MMLYSAIIDKVSMFHCSMMLHPQSIYESSKVFPPDIVLDNPTIQLPIIDPLPSKFFTAIVWGNIGQEEIDIVIEFSTKWVKYGTPLMIAYSI